MGPLSFTQVTLETVLPCKCCKIISFLKYALQITLNSDLAGFNNFQILLVETFHLNSTIVILYFLELTRIANSQKIFPLPIFISPDFS